MLAARLGQLTANFKQVIVHAAALVLSLPRRIGHLVQLQLESSHFSVMRSAHLCRFLLVLSSDLLQSNANCNSTTLTSRTGAVTSLGALAPFLFHLFDVETGKTGHAQN